MQSDLAQRFLGIPQVMRTYCITSVAISIFVSMSPIAEWLYSVRDRMVILVDS